MTRSRIALVVALLAVFAGATTTAYSAGLAKNSVGTPQLKKNAVTSAKIKKGAVTAAKIKKGVLTPKPKTFERSLLVSNADFTYFTYGGLRFEGACKAVVQDNSFLTVENATPSGQISYAGTSTTHSNSGTFSSVERNGGTAVLEQYDVVVVAGQFSETHFVGEITPVGKPPVLVQMYTKVEDGEGCSVFVSATATK